MGRPISPAMADLDKLFNDNFNMVWEGKTTMGDAVKERHGDAVILSFCASSPHYVKFQHRILRVSASPHLRVASIQVHILPIQPPSVRRKRNVAVPALFKNVHLIPIVLRFEYAHF